MRAADLMTRDVVTLEAEATVGDAMQLLGEHGIRHVPILEGGALLGLVSDRDLRRVEGLIALSVSSPEGSGTDVLQSRVRTLLGGPAVTVSAGDPVDRVIDRFLSEGVGALVVLDEHGKLAGIISYVDVLRAAKGRLG